MISISGDEEDFIDLIPVSKKPRLEAMISESISDNFCVKQNALELKKNRFLPTDFDEHSLIVRHKEKVEIKCNVSNESDMKVILDYWCHSSKTSFSKMCGLRKTKSHKCHEYHCHHGAKAGKKKFDSR